MTRQDTSPSTIPNLAVPPALDSTLRVEGRSYTGLSQALADLPEILSSVQSKTGWSLSLNDVKLEVVSPRELNRRIVLDDLRRVGVPVTQEAPLFTRAFNHLQAVAYYHGVIASYLPKEGTILINEARLQGASKDAVKSTMHHELTHVGQHQRHPKFMQALDNAAREYRLWSSHGHDFPADEQERQCQKFLDRVQARMSLLEGQAVALQRKFEEELNLVPEVKLGAVDLVLGLTHRFMTGMSQKLGQYLQGEEIFSRIHALGIEEVDALFKSPAYTDLVFGRENPIRASRA
jgi:hypothetical protein